jgi:hypothetical protein
MARFKGAVATCNQKTKEFTVRVSKRHHPLHQLGGQLIPVIHVPYGIKLRPHDSVTFEIVKLNGVSCADRVQLA